MDAAAKTIFHVDMDAFFVSVEELSNPSLRGKAVVVGGDRDERGVVSAASYEARKFGVHSAMPLRTAAKLCPHAIFLHGHPELYREYSEKAFEVLNSFTPKLEMASIDEAYLDMTNTERLHGHALKAADALHARMKEQTKLNCSIGVAGSRLVAKVASDQAKPNGILWVLAGMEAALLAPLDIRKIPGVGKVTERKLNDIGIRRVGDLAKMPVEQLRDQLGDWAVALAGKARGLDAGGWFDHDIAEDRGPKSIGHEHTYPQDQTSEQVLQATLVRLSEMVARRLREHNLHARTIELKLRYSDFTTLTRSRTLERSTQIDGEILSLAQTLLKENLVAGRAVRLLGVTASSFDSGQMQMQLSGQDGREKWRRALASADELRGKYGEEVISLATGIKRRFREKTHENPAGLRGKPKQ